MSTMSTYAPIYTSTMDYGAEYSWNIYIHVKLPMIAQPIKLYLQEVKIDKMSSCVRVHLLNVQ